MSQLLEIDDLETAFHVESGVVRAVRGVDLDIAEGQRVGLVGESGSGKSVTARSILRLIESPGEIENGEIRYRGANILEMSSAELRDIRGEDIAMVFQNTSNSLDPVYKIEDQMTEAIVQNRDVSETEATEIALDMLEEVEMPRPKGVMESYPHELSGGMKQRVMIGMALAFEPDILIADEPTSALDVTIQKKLLSVLRDVVLDRNLSLLWITHNLGVVAQFCDHIAVMYAGEIVEYGTAQQIFKNPTHPYTRELLKTMPDVRQSQEEYHVIPGSVPNMQNPPSGCAFYERCPDAEPRCKETHPDRVQGGQDHQAACLVHDVGNKEGHTNDR